MLQKDSLFRRNDPRPAPVPLPPPIANAPEPPPAHAAVHPTVHPDPAKPKSEQRKEARLQVGPDIKMKGVEIADCDTLVVEGRIEATLDARLLQIAENGVFTGVVAVDMAEIHGRLDGELTVRKQLVIHATGKVTGKLRYARIKVEEGAELSGEIGVLELPGSGPRTGLVPPRTPDTRGH